MGIDAEMFVRTNHPLSAEAVHELAWELGEAFGAEKFWIFRPEEGRTYERRALAIIDTYEQDGPTLTPHPGEQFLAVAPATRYYGIGYERGDLPFLIALAEWLELRIDGGSVWYGGDSSGVKAAPFTAHARGTLFAHFALHGHRPYTGDPRVMDGRRDFLDSRDMLQPRCTFCQQPMYRSGFGGEGGGYGKFSCLGCGKQQETHDHGATWIDPQGHAAQIIELERQLNWHRAEMAKAEPVGSLIDPRD